MEKKVAIIGAGLSGLACGVELKRYGVIPTVFESNSYVGGRVGTEDYQGYKLDYGFQAFLPSYELGPYFFDYKNLNLKAFSPGARIYKSGKFNHLSDPLRDPRNLLNTLFSTSATIKDKALTTKLIFSKAPAYININQSKTTLEFLKEYGFSQRYIDNFFKPFFSGVFLNEELSVSSHFFRYIFKKFSKAYASLPEKGMNQLPLQLANEIGQENITLNKSISLDEVELTEFDYIVWAGKPENVEYHSVTTHYFKTTSNKWASKTLYLNAESNKPINHIACLTAVNPSYAPKDWHLYSVNVLQEANLEAISTHLAEMFGSEEVNQWHHLKSFKIKEALPKNPYYGKFNPGKDKVIYCGDYLESASIQGALSSGLKAARSILSSV